jgi:hypothetical protein
MRRLVAGAVAVIAAAVAGCSGEPSGAKVHTLSPAERQALSAILMGSPQIGAYGPIASLALSFVDQAGELTVTTTTTSATSAVYNAVVLWMDIDATTNGVPVVTQFFAVLAWQGTGASITKLTAALGVANTAPSNVSLGPTFNPASGGTAMVTSAPYSITDLYVSTAGTLAINSLNFTSGSTAYTQGTLQGTYQRGSVGGSYTFTAASGVNNLNQAADFSAALPAVHVFVQGTF